MTNNIKNLIGLKFGNLIVKEMYNERTKDGRIQWICQCICGKEKIFNGHYLKRGEVKGCGCTITKRLRAKVGKDNPNWKGGKNNRGSIAWANGKISDLNKFSERYNYPKIYCTTENLIKIFNESKEKCAICNKIEGESQYKRNHIDHNHKTGKIRGMLCPNCNTGLGSFKESPELLLKAIEYIKNNL